MGSSVSIETSCVNGNVTIKHHQKELICSQITFPIITTNDNSKVTSVNFKGGKNNCLLNCPRKFKVGDKINISVKIPIQNNWEGLKKIDCPQGSGILVLRTPKKKGNQCCNYSCQNIGIFLKDAKICDNNLVFRYVGYFSHHFYFPKSELSFSLDTMFNPISNPT